MMICAATRIHSVPVSSELEVKVIKFLKCALSYCKNVLIAVKVDLSDEMNGQELFHFVQKIVNSQQNLLATVVVLPISQWGPGVTPALNALLQRALLLDATHILYQSLEVQVSVPDVLRLSELCGEDTLVAGARFQGHDFAVDSVSVLAHPSSAISVAATGRSVPWNTLALWNASTLAVTGFPMVADGVIKGTAWGVEEVSAIALAQLVSPEKTKAKLVTLPSVQWKASFHDPVRQAAHESKMESKLSRPATHLNLLPSSAQGVVEHIAERVVGETSVTCESESAMDSTEHKMKIVLVTGGAGFIGCHTTAQLLMRGDCVVIVDEMNAYYSVEQKEDNLKWLESLARLPEHGDLVIVRGDICDEALMRSVFEDHGITHVIHLAARAGVRPSIDDPMIYVHSNVRGTTQLLELARQFHIQHFVYASSSSVYGDTSREVFRESDRTDSPVSPYAATKKSCELIAASFSHLYQLPTAGLRFFTVYGPRGRPDMAPYLFIDNICQERALKQFGDGTSERDYTYVDDIVSGVLGALDHPLGCKVYNLGNGKPISLKSFITLAGKCVGKEPIIKILPPQAGDVNRTCADISLARELIGYNPQVQFAVGMQRTTEWFLNRHLSNLTTTDATNATGSCSSVSIDRNAESSGSDNFGLSGVSTDSSTADSPRSSSSSVRSKSWDGIGMMSRDCRATVAGLCRRHRDTTSVTGNRSKGKA